MLQGCVTRLTRPLALERLTQSIRTQGPCLTLGCCTEGTSGFHRLALSQASVRKLARDRCNKRHPAPMHRHEAAGGPQVLLAPSQRERERGSKPHGNSSPGGGGATFFPRSKFWESNGKTEVNIFQIACIFPVSYWREVTGPSQYSQRRRFLNIRKQRSAMALLQAIHLAYCNSLPRWRGNEHSSVIQTTPCGVVACKHDCSLQ